MTTLGEFVMDAIRDPDNADTAGLLREASAFLKNRSQWPEPDLLALARRLARSAEDFGFLQDDDSLQALKLSVRAYSMASQAINAEKVGN